jgi:hypothetical protein
LDKNLQLYLLGKNKIVLFAGMILDAGYLMLDIPEFPESEIQKHPVSSLPGPSSERAKTGNRYPGSRHIVNAFHYNG